MRVASALGGLDGRCLRSLMHRQCQLIHSIGQLMLVLYQLMLVVGQLRQGIFHPLLRWCQLGNSP